jgi:membrane-associated phospholipid phosphatase
MRPGRLAALLRPRGPRLLRAVLSMAAFGVPVLVLAFAVRQQSDVVVAFDQEAIRAATDVTRASGLAHALVVVQELTKPVVVYALATLVVVRVWRVDRLPTRALWAFTTMMVTWNLGALAKLVVRRTRPVVDDPVSHASGYSFPSGHALNAAAAAATLLILLWPLLSPAARRAGLGLGLLLVAGVSADRIFLGVHFPSDVVAGLLLGLGLTFSSWIGFGGPGTSSRVPEPAELALSAVAATR